MSDTTWNHHFVQSNGVRMHYVRHGQGVPIILLHGWPEFWYAWHKNIRVLSTQFDVIVPDLRGFGQSEKPAGTAEQAYTLDHHVGDLLGLIDALGLETVGLVSHDAGAMVAQQFALEHADRVAGLFFFNVPYPGIGARWAAPENINEIWYQGFNQQAWAPELLRTSRDAARVYFGNMLAHWAHDPHTFEADLDVWVDNFLAPGNLEGGFNWYRAILKRRIQIIRAEVAEAPPIDTPTCVRWGEQESLLPIEYADRLSEYFTDLDFQAAPDAGHFVHYEKPAFANQEIAAFFERVFN